MFDRSLDTVPDTEAFPTPEEAVLGVVPRGTEVVSVIATSPGGRDVEVRSQRDSGTFTLRRRDAGWLVKSGEGCAAWPAAGTLLSGDDESELDETEAAREGAVLQITRADVREIHQLFDRWLSDLGAQDYDAMCAAQTVAFSADLVDYVHEELEDRITCAAAVSAVAVGFDVPGPPLIHVQAMGGAAEGMAIGRQGSSTWTFAREGGAWNISYFPYASTER